MLGVGRLVLFKRARGKSSNNAHSNEKNNEKAADPSVILIDKKN
jgi:hypothetical protein